MDVAIKIKKEIVMDKLLKVVIWPVVLAPLIYLAVVGNDLPERLPVHFNLKGEADRYGGKTEFFLTSAGMTVLAILIYLFLPLIYKIDPKRTAGENKLRLPRLAFTIAFFISLLNCFMINSAETGNTKINGSLFAAGMGLLWCLLGNYMYNIKSNYFIGIRLPWTLHDENNWKQTHRLAGKLWFGGGLLIILTAFVLPQTIIIYLLISITLLIILIPVIYSYSYFRKQKINQKHIS
jgi:uncharacterized membrane protein